MSFSHQFHPTILRAYDIRGIFEDTLTTNDAYAIGRSFALIVSEQANTSHPSIAIGRDGRLSAPALAKALAEGLVDGGAKVQDIGIGPTPMLYFADRHLHCDGAIQVTGSHNPPTHNGFKLVCEHQSFFGADIKKLGEKALSLGDVVDGGSYQQVQIQDAYVERLLADADFGQLKVVWDTGNGAAGPAMAQLLEQLPQSDNHSLLFADVDGHFPNHHPNPVDPETLAFLQQQVAERSADCGIGFDGDGDRIGIIDAKGRLVAGDLLTAYLAQAIAPKYQAPDIIFDVKSSQMAMDLVAETGAKPSLYKTGHSHLKQKMAALNAPLAGEMSGHIFIKDNYYGFDDGLYVAVRVLSQMQQTGQSITEFMDSLPDIHASPELHIACADEKKFTAMEALADYAARHAAPADEINDIDGVRLTNDEGWWLIRASNTEAKLVVRAEGRDRDALLAMLASVQSHLAAIDIDWTPPV